MRNTTKILDYYLDSERCFENYIQVFFDTYKHFGKCKNNNKYSFESEIYKNIMFRIKSQSGFDLSLSHANEIKYFRAGYSDKQLFAIIFAYWYGLSDMQIRKIADKRNRKISWDILNFYLCFPDKSLLSRNDLKNNHFQNLYIIHFDKKKEIKAKYDNRYLIDIETDNKFQIL